MPAGAKPGERRGGRKKGIPNKDKRELIDMIQERFPGYHPVLAMAEIANDLDNDKKLRFDATKEVAQYVVPKRKAVEVSGNLDLAIVPSEELERLKQIAKNAAAS